MSESIYVLEPWQEPNITKKQRVAPRLDTLTGTVVGLLDNYKPNADKLLHALAERLQSRYGVVRSIYFRKEPKWSNHVSEDEQAKLSGSNFVITASGD